MKNILCSAVLILAAIVFYPQTFTKAQEIDSVIQLSVESRTIAVTPDSCATKIGGYIWFVTDDKTTTFQVSIDNYDHFIDSPSDLITFSITSKDTVMIRIDSPPDGDVVKYYSVGAPVSAGKVPPLPPLAPPRIVILKIQ